MLCNDENGHINFASDQETHLYYVYLIVDETAVVIGRVSVPAEAAHADGKCEHNHKQDCQDALSI